MVNEPRCYGTSQKSADLRITTKTADGTRLEVTVVMTIPKGVLPKVLR